MPTRCCDHLSADVSKMLSIVPSIVVLGLVALAAIALARRHQSSAERGPERRAAALALLLATVMQAVHFGEELATGFHERFPALFGLPPMPLSFFVGFNLAWIVIWIAAVPGVQSGKPVAFFAAWFLALAGMLNAIAHPLLALAANGYFPGLVTSPFIGAAALWLWSKLQRAVSGPVLRA